MKITAKLMFASALAAAVLGSPAMARDGAAAASEFERWSAEVQRGLEKGLRTPQPLGRPSDPVGVVEVAFKSGADGRPADVRVLNSSGSRMLDGMARKSVRRLATLQPLPTGLPDGQIFVARILFVPADNPADEAQRHELVSRAAVDNRWYTDAELAARGTPVLRLAAAR